MTLKLDLGPQFRVQATPMAESFQFNFKVQEGKAKEDSCSDDEYASGEDDGLDYEDEGEFSWEKAPNEEVWPSYDPRLLQPADELRATRRDLEAVHDQDEIEVAPGLFLLKGRVSGAEAAELLKNEDVSDSDLIPSVYEGGFKLWEGAIDLCTYLLQKYGLTGPGLLSQEMMDSPLQGKKVLELGCGHGLPGIVALMAGAEVHFQDYNREVLSRLTIPNVLSNMNRLPPGRSRGTSRFFSGDWHSVGELLTSKGFGGHYDLIITSESIYSVESQRRMIECVKQVLQPPLGVVLVAAKSFYFGVGGGIKTFKQAVKHDGIFEVQHVYRTTRDVSGAMRPMVKGGAAAEEQQQPAVVVEAGVAAAAGEVQGTGDVAEGGQQAVDASGEAAGEGSGDAGEGKAAGESAAGGGTDGDAGGNVREVLQLTFPAAILPYFL